MRCGPSGAFLPRRRHGALIRPSILGPLAAQRGRHFWYNSLVGSNLLRPSACSLYLFSAGRFRIAILMRIDARLIINRFNEYIRPFLLLYVYASQQYRSFHAIHLPAAAAAAELETLSRHAHQRKKLGKEKKKKEKKKDKQRMDGSLDAFHHRRSSKWMRRMRLPRSCGFASPSVYVCKCHYASCMTLATLLPLSRENLTNKTQSAFYEIEIETPRPCTGYLFVFFLCIIHDRLHPRIGLFPSLRVPVLSFFLRREITRTPIVGQSLCRASRPSAYPFIPIRHPISDEGGIKTKAEGPSSPVWLPFATGAV